jgi:putative transposase
MPRANRYILPGYTYHLTHRCHNRAYLLRYRLDRAEYLRRLRKNVVKHNISLFNFCITCNHVHLLATCKKPQDISLFMQQLEGEFADFYNARKSRNGAFWGERFHCTMIDDEEHLWNCMKYIDLNMVRAGVVGHPGKWPWCGYQELVGVRQRYRLLDTGLLLDRLGIKDRKALSNIHQLRINEALKNQHLNREAYWTESIAVGSDRFLNEIISSTKKRKRLYKTKNQEGISYIKETFLILQYRVTRLDAEKSTKISI